MTHNISRKVTGAAVLAFGLLLSARSDAASAKRVQFTQSELKKARQERADYQKCRKQALRRAKTLQGDKRSRYLKLAVNHCREQFPAISILRDCKKEAVRAYKDRPEYLKAAVQECRDSFKQSLFDPSDPLPLRTHADDLFFAGAGLNAPLRLKILKTLDGPKDNRQFGNFNCSVLSETAAGQRPPEYLLFGNDLRSFLPLRTTSFEQLRSYFSDQQTNPEELLDSPANGATTPTNILNRDWGELSFDTTEERTTQYFPASFCSFNRQLGNLYADIKIYYLLDRDSKTAVPYFGISFYQPEAKVEPQTLIENLQAKLGSDFEIRHKKGKHWILAKTGFLSFDEEGDPYNLCQFPRLHHRLAILSLDEQDQYVNYFLLSNLDNLCKYGDRLASRLLKSGL